MNAPFADIIGHAGAVERLSLMLTNDCVPHALLIQGPRHAGKRALAEAFARALLGAAALETHPDFRLVERGRDEKTGKLRKGIAVDDIRDLRDHLRMTSFFGGRKIAIIDEAERLSDEASNALLKTLEEPSGKTCLILIAHASDALLPTVRSRLSTVSLRRLSESEVASALRSRGAGEAETIRWAALSGGLPGLALGFREEDDMLHWYENEDRRWRAFRAAPLHERFSLAGDLSPAKADREETVGKLREAIAVWEGALRRELRGGSASAARLLRGLFSLRASLEINVQPRLLLERFLASFDSP